MTLEFIFKSIILSCILVSCLYCYEYFKIILKQNYWNCCPEKEFMIKLKCIISSIDRNFVTLKPKDILSDLNNIYNKMTFIEKRDFREKVLKNGLKPRLETLINKHY